MAKGTTKNIPPEPRPPTLNELERQRQAKKRKEPPPSEPVPDSG